jgi:hypothetical protein
MFRLQRRAVAFTRIRNEGGEVPDVRSEHRPPNLPFYRSCRHRCRANLSILLIIVGRETPKDRLARQPVGGCRVSVSFGHGQRRHCPRRVDGVPQGSRTAYQGDSEPYALPRYDRWRESPRPPYTPLYGARHDRIGVPRVQAPEGSLTSQGMYSSTHSGE